MYLLAEQKTYLTGVSIPDIEVDSASAESETSKQEDMLRREFNGRSTKLGMNLDNNTGPL